MKFKYNQKEVRKIIKQMKSIKKCFICKNIVSNENINKDGKFFCSNDCEADYYHKYVK